MFHRKSLSSLYHASLSSFASLVFSPFQPVIMPPLLHMLQPPTRDHPPPIPPRSPACSSPICMSVFWLRGRHSCQNLPRTRARPCVRLFQPTCQPASVHPGRRLAWLKCAFVAISCSSIQSCKRPEAAEGGEAGKTHNSLEKICFLCRLDARKVDFFFFLIDCSPKARL